MDITKVAHFIGIAFLFLGFGFQISYRVTLNELREVTSLKKTGAILNGIGLLILLVTGLGMTHRLPEFPIWAWVKIGLWLLMGMSFSLIKRGRLPIFALVAFVLLLGSLAVFVASSKPF
jgi:hypothetical protein